jgi:hypothetical protein
MESFLFIVSKVLRPMLTSPLFLCLLASTAALFMLKAGSRLAKILKIAALILIAITTLISIPAVANGIAALWEYPLSDIGAASARGPYAAAIVLGGSLDPVSSKSGRIEGFDSFDAAERCGHPVPQRPCAADYLYRRQWFAYLAR